MFMSFKKIDVDGAMMFEST